MSLIHPDKIKLVSFKLEELIRGDKTPSVQYKLFNKDSILFSFQQGFADISNKIEVSENTTFNAYSVTKTFTALAILQLVEQGKLQLDQSVKSILSDFPYPENITLKQILNHTAGIPNPIPLSWVHLPEEHDTFNWHAFFNNIFQKHNKIHSLPNEKFSYSNLGYVLLGEIIERVSGRTYEDFILQNIINPLQLSSDELNFKINHLDKHSKAYHKKWSFSYLILGFLIDKSKLMNKSEGKWISFKPNYVNGPSYGGLIGTSSAFIKYLQELLKPENGLISNHSKSLLFTENNTNDNRPSGMCLSWFKGTLSGKAYYAHAGGGAGFYCELRIYPNLGIGSVIVFNKTGMSDERILNKFDIHFINDLV